MVFMVSFKEFEISNDSRAYLSSVCVMSIIISDIPLIIFFTTLRLSNEQIKDTMYEHIICSTSTS